MTKHDVNELLLPLPEGGPTSLRAMVRDPGTLWVYWRPGVAPADRYEVRAEGPTGTLARFEVPEDGTECWVSDLTPGMQGRIVLLGRVDGVWSQVAAVPFSMPFDRPGVPDASAAWRHAKETAEPTPAPAGERPAEDVFEEERVYHGRIWRPS